MTDIITKLKIIQNQKNKQLILIKINTNKQNNLEKITLKPIKPIKLEKPVKKPTKPTKPTQNQNNHLKNALLIGCNYKNSDSELFGCINDSNNIAELLKKYNFNNITILSDDTNTKPTRDNILNNFKKLLLESKEGDILFFSFSGHGTQTHDFSKDELDGKDEMILTSDFKNIIDDEFNNILISHLKKNVKLFALFDSCHSGSMMDLKYQYDKNLITNKTSANLQGTVVMISGCKDSQTSTDAYINKTSQGAMTWSFLKSLENNPKNVLDLSNSMKTLLKDNYNQIPQISSNTLLENVNIFFK